jgi:hypothetical protein
MYFNFKYNKLELLVFFTTEALVIINKNEI